MLNWKNSCVGRYKILEMNQKKYLIDTLNTKPSFLLFATSPEVVKFNIAEIDSQSSTFDKEENEFKIGPFLAVLITQPIVGLLYRFGKTFFTTNSISERILFKLFLFILTIIISIFAFIVVSKIDKYKLEKNESLIFNKQLSVYTKGQKNYLIITMLGILSIIGILYLKTQNGSESAYIYLSSIVTFGFLIFVRYIPQSNYKDFEYDISQLK